MDDKNTPQDEEQNESGPRPQEDRRFVTGKAEYTADIVPNDALCAAVLRSPYPHATITDIHTSEATSLEGIINVFTGKDLKSGKVSNEIPAFVPPEMDVPKNMFRRILATDRVRFQGEPVAIAIGVDQYKAHDALDLIEVQYERLDSVTDPENALKQNTPSLYDQYSQNVVFERNYGDPQKVDELLEEAAYTRSIEISEQRLIPNPIEPRAVLAEYSSGNDTVTLRISTQTPHEDRETLSTVLSHPEHKIRVIPPDVGGAFGSKIPLYPAEIAVTWCALQLEEPIMWQATRTESFQSDAHGRGLGVTGEMGFTEEGNILGLRVEGTADLGAYISSHELGIPTSFFNSVLSGPYDMPAISYHVDGVLTNTAPTDAYRGVTETTATTLLERLMHLAAKDLKMDQATIRQKNYISDFPFEAATGLVYHSGDYGQALEKALELIDYEEVREKKQQYGNSSHKLGIGLSSFIEVTGLGPAKVCKSMGRDEHWESSRVVVDKSGNITVYCGTTDQGQGHKTSLSQIAAEKLEIPPTDVNIVEGDTERISAGKGTFASRSLTVGGASVDRCLEKVYNKAQKIAAYQLEVSDTDLRFENGKFHIEGSPERSMSIQAIAKEAYRGWNLPDGMEPGLEESVYYSPEDLCVSFGTHIAVVEVNTKSGEIEIKRYGAVDDCGEQIEPEIVEGQIQGGVAQGIGQALYENAVYDDSGNLISGSFQDYTIPKAHMIPEIKTQSTTTPSPHNPIGAKGIGEAGAIAAPAAVMNAIVDALSPYDIDHLDTPITAEKIWSCLKAV